MKIIFSKLVLSLAVIGLAACASKQAVQNDTDAMHPAQQSYNPGERYPSSQGSEWIVEGGPAAKISKCGRNGNGSAQLIRRNGQLFLDVQNIECASWASSRNEFNVNKLNDEGRGHGGLIPVDESDTGWRTVIIGSKNFIQAYRNNPNKTGNFAGDLIQFYIPPQKVVLELRDDGQSRPQRLNRCGGTVEAKINKDRSLSVIFRDVEICGNFALKGNNGEIIGKAYAINTDRNQNYSGSFTVPKKDLQWGTNVINMSVYSYGLSEDLMQLNVYAGY